MSVLAGYLSGETEPASLHLAAQFAYSLGEPLLIATIFSLPRISLATARTDSKLTAYAQKLADDSKQQAQQLLGPLAEQIDINYLQITARSAADGLLEAAQSSNARLLVIGSTGEGRPGQLAPGSTGDWLIHSSPVPLAIAPLGYHRPPCEKLQRLTFAYSGTHASTELVFDAQQWAQQMGLPLRVVSFAIRRGAMYPPEVGLHVEASLQQAWCEDLTQAQAKLQADPRLADAQFCVQQAGSWPQALTALPWQTDEILVLGASSRPSITGLFLGSRGAKIIRHSPVPVLLLPG